MSTPSSFKGTGGFDATNQKVTSLADATNPQDALNLRTFDAKNTVQTYNPARTYPIDYVIEYGGQLWKCINSTTGAFDKTKWSAIRGTENWIRITGPYTAIAMDSLVIDTTATPLSITLPASPKSGDYITIVDAGNADINNITVIRNGATIAGQAVDLVLNESAIQVTLVYLGGTWILNIERQKRVKFVSAAATVESNVVYALLIAGSFTVTLPAAPKSGDWVSLIDRNGTAGTYPITVSGGVKQIDGASTFLFNQKKAAYQFIYNGTGWVSFMLAGNALLVDKNLSDVVDPAAARTNLGLGTAATVNMGTGTSQVRTNTQNDTVYQPLDQTLTAFAALVLSANKLVYSTGVDTFDSTALTAEARTFLAQATKETQRSSMGLGSAAIADVGTALGQLMSVGSFGLGSAAASNTTPDSIVVTGFYTLPTTATNGPTAVYASTLLHVEKSVSVDGGATQFAIDTNSVLWIRNRNAGVWTAWSQFATSGSYGSAAFKDVGESAGQVLLVGAFGLGTSVKNISTAGYDVNTLVKTGFYSITGTPVNGPVLTDQNIIVVANTTGAGHSFQISQPIDTEDYYIRSQNAGTWSSWKKLYHSGNTGWVPYLPSLVDNKIYAVKNGAWVVQPTEAVLGDIKTGTAVDKYVTPAAITQYLESIRPKVAKFPVVSRTDNQFGNMHVVMQDGTVTAWGNNEVIGILGNGETVAAACWDQTKLVFNVPYPDGTTVKDLYKVGSSIYALMSNGWVYSCGANTYGQLGLGDTTARYIMTRIEWFITNSILIDKMSVTGSSKWAGTLACAYFITTTKTLYSVGYNNVGQLGVGDVTNRSLPALVSGVSNVRDVYCGGDQHQHVACVTVAGGLYMWGYNTSGQLGTGNTTTSNIPVSITTVAPVVSASVVAGWDSTGSTTHVGSTLILCNNNKMYSTGYNGYGQLGDFTKTNHSSFAPVNTAGLGAAVISDCGLFGGQYASGWAVANGNLYTWGIASGGDIGQTQVDFPYSVYGYLDSTGTFVNSAVGFQGNIAKVVVNPGVYRTYWMMVLDTSGNLWFTGTDVGYITTSAATATRTSFMQVVMTPLPAGEKFIDVFALCGGNGSQYLRVFALTNKGNLYARGYDYGGTTRALGQANTTTTFLKSFQQVVMDK